MTKLQQLKKIIAKAVPSVIIGYTIKDLDWKKVKKYREITLEDVLIAYKKNKPSLYIRDDGVFFLWEKFTEGGSGHHGVKPTLIEWIFGKPLNDQKPETISFLLELLRPK